jgi:type VI secretion system secreted protein Hcp
MNKGCRMFPLLAVAVFLALQPAVAQVKGFVSIQGVQGESTDDNHKGWIEVLSVDLGTNNRLLRGGATTRSSSRTPGACTLVKTMDKASPLLMQKVSSGQSLGTVELNFMTTDSEGNSVYLKYTMTDCIVTSFSPSSSGGEGGPAETVTINYKSANWEYVPFTKIKRSL